VSDQQPDAYQRLVERLLSSKHYGERWARHWLDLARYADTHGYEKDATRTMWKFRDWVIDAFNRDMPFDQFTVEQIAGDMLPNPTESQKIATGFHRNTMTNNEGGTSDEEFRNIAVVDRVNTTLQVWMGVTVNCAQCHQHKYDPISQDEYFQLFAIFNQSEDSDRSDNGPNLPYLPTQDKKKKAAWDTILAGAEKLLTDVAPDVAPRQQAWEKENAADAANLAKLPMNVQAALKVAPAKRNPVGEISVRREKTIQSAVIDRVQIPPQVGVVHAALRSEKVLPFRNHGNSQRHEQNRRHQMRAPAVVRRGQGSIVVRILGDHVDPRAIIV
jgi:hypothetical protein